MGGRGSGRLPDDPRGARSVLRGSMGRPVEKGRPGRFLRFLMTSGLTTDHNFIRLAELYSRLGEVRRGEIVVSKDEGGTMVRARVFTPRAGRQE